MSLDLARFRENLLARRDSLLAEDVMSAADRAPVTLEQDSVGRLSRIDAMQVQAMALAQARRRQSERAAIDAALNRIENDEYGYCLKCGEDIAPARLEHNPAFTTCIECAKES
ncbi:MAG: TraR/DksA C4-type zinc finger protein [Parasphingorhabdus sp.]|nr:TraR/DksA C4-type zinc finger protein [Parasphingorhabdus sp.]